MKQLTWFLTVLATTALVVALMSFALPQHAAHASPVQSAVDLQTQPECSTGRSIQVSGTAVVKVVPDRALIQLGIQSNGATPLEVEKSNSAVIQAVIKAVRALGVEEQDIATDWYVVEPIYENYDSLYIKGYRINNIVAITLRDVSKTSRVISYALLAGANQVINVDFYTSELRKYRDQAREMAMKAAKEKAQALSSAAGSETGCVLSISENSWSYYNGWWYGRGQNQNQWTQNSVQNAPSAPASSSAGDEPVSLGRISVQAEINATFALK
jgi:uncharacterized protein